MLKTNCLKLSNIGCVVQLDRISDFGSEGWGFESLRGHFNQKPLEKSKGFFSENFEFILKILIPKNRFQINIIIILMTIINSSFDYVTLFITFFVYGGVAFYKFKLLILK